MSMTPEDAASALNAIHETERRTSRAVLYRQCSAALFLWGGICFVGYAHGQFNPTQAGVVWLALQIAGFIGTTLLLRSRARPGHGAAQRWRFMAALLFVMAFGMLVVGLLGPLSGRQIDAFWPLLFMLAYAVAGLWVGRFFVVCAGAVVALTLIGYAWSGPWFSLWMAVTEGVGLCCGGAWLRWRGAAT